MIKTFCDCCGNEVNSTLKFSYYVHVQGKPFDGYEDRETGEPTSGRSTNKDLCLKCYNKILGVAYKTFVQMQEKSIK